MDSPGSEHDVGSDYEFVGDKALELIRFQHSGNGLTLTLNEEHLKSVLSTTEGRPLVIISIVGPTRQGKSVMLNFIKRGLEGMESDEVDWMDWTNQRRPLTGFSWKHGIAPETKGIWIWSRAFLVDTDEDEVAVLLLDTQGIDQECPSREEISAIFGLTTLLSSVQVLNFSGDIPEEAFSYLSTYLKYGLLNLENLNEKPFQKLMFLVRDWNNPGQHQYGMKGGKQLLEEKLKLNGVKVKGKVAKEQRQIRDAIKKTTKLVECFIMPNIGETAIVQDSTCSVTDLAQDFTKFLETCVNGLTSSESLPIKKIFGNEIKSMELHSFLTAYVKLINSSDSGEEKFTPESIWDCTANTCYENVIKNAMRKYHESFNKKKNSANYEQEQILNTAHVQAKRQAMTVFKKTNLLEEFQDQYQAQLNNELNQAIKTYKDHNEQNRQRFVSTRIQEAREQYVQCMTNQLSFREDKIIFFEDGYIQSISEREQQNVVQQFMSCFEEEDPDKLEILMMTLKEVLQSSLESFLKKNSVNKQKAETFMNSFVWKLVNDYTGELNSFLVKDPNLDVFILNHFQRLSRENTMKKFLQLEKPGHDAFQKEYMFRLETSIDGTSEQINGSQQLKNDAASLQTEQLLEQQRLGYLQTLTGLAETVKSPEQLLKLHRNAIPNIMKKFEESMAFPSGSSQRDSFNQKLISQLESTYKVVVEEEVLQKKKSEDIFRTASENSFQMYQREMSKVREAVTFLEEIDLQTKHESFSLEALAYFTNATNVQKKPLNAKKYAESLKKNISLAFENVQQENINSKTLAYSKAQELITSYLTEYEKMMKGPSIKSKTEDEFRNAHSNTMTSISRSFTAKLSRNNQAFIDEHVEKLKAEIDPTFEELQGIFEGQRMREKSAMREALEPARKYYHEEMQKHVKNHEFLAPTQLVNFHDRVSKAAINLPAVKAVLTEAQKDELAMELAKSFRKWQEENDMALNWDSKVEPAIGIDLGTTYSCVAVYYKGKVTVIRNGLGKNTTPSYVAFEEDENGVVSHIVGEPAKDIAYRNPENTVFDAKRIIGRKMNDEKLQEDMKFWPFEVFQGKEGPAIKIRGKEYPPEQIAAILLRHFKEEAEGFLNRAVKKAVITVPAYFTDSQRQATLDAGRIAGLEVLALLNEPTAAAMAYKLERFDEEARKVLIFDLGGGTFDISVLETVGSNIEVLGVDGDTHLGGEDFDQNMMKYCVKEFEDNAQTGINLFVNKDSNVKNTRDSARQCLRRIQTHCEKGKQALSAAQAHDVALDSVLAGEDLKVRITRRKFEELNAPLFQRTITIVDQALRDVGLRKEDIDDIVLVGGSTRILKVQEMLTDYFNGKALSRIIHPDEAVAYGAAVHAAMMNGNEAKKLFNFQDVTPMSLGIEANMNGVSGQFSIIVPKNTKIPTTKMEPYYTSQDNQTSVRVKIYQGESSVAAKNAQLGNFLLDGIPKAPKGNEKVEVTMIVNENGIIHVDGVCKSTGERKGIQVLSVRENKGLLSSSTVERLVNEVENASKPKFKNTSKPNTPKKFPNVRKSLH